MDNNNGTHNSNDEDKVVLHTLLGSSIGSNATFDSSNDGLVAYSAGNTVNVLDTSSGGTFLTHTPLLTRRPITALRLSPSTSTLFAASEEVVKLVDYNKSVVRADPLVQLQQGTSIVALAIHPGHGLLTTVSSDRVVSVYDYKNASSFEGGGKARKLASSTVATSKVSSIAFSPTGSYFVTGGARHLKFWYLQLGKNECVLTGRPAILGSEHSAADFTDLTTDGSQTFAVANFSSSPSNAGAEATSSTLCQFDERRFLDKWVQLKTSNAYCLALEQERGDASTKLGDLLFIGCSDGIIRTFRAGRLDFVATLPLPHHLGVDISKATTIQSLSHHPPGSKFPNVLAISAPGGKKVVAAYADHSIYVWDVQDVKRVGLSHSYLYHSGCIWDVFVSANNANGFVTCSNDDTVRVWETSGNNNNSVKPNLYSSDCTLIKYITTQNLDSSTPSLTQNQGLRTVTSTKNQTIIAGDRSGHLRLLNPASSQIIKIKAHKEEVLTMDVLELENNCTLVATGSRDGSVSVFEVTPAAGGSRDEVSRLAELHTHAGSVTAVRFTSSPQQQQHYLSSTSADKTLQTHSLTHSAKDFQLVLLQKTVSKSPLFDLQIDPSQKHILVACSDSCVRVYGFSSGKHSKTLRSPGVGGTFIKLAMDPSGYYCAVSSTDKSVVVFDFLRSGAGAGTGGGVVAVVLGHSELVTSLSFTTDQLITVGGDACIFIWSLSRDMVVTMEARLQEVEKRRKQQNSSSSNNNAFTPELKYDSETTPEPVTTVNSPSLTESSSGSRSVDYRFSMGQLPDWAKKSMSNVSKPSAPGGPPPGSDQKKSMVALPKGKWSESYSQATLNSGVMTIKSYYSEDSSVVGPVVQQQQQQPLPMVPLVRRERSFSSSNEGIKKKEDSTIPPPPPPVIKLETPPEDFHHYSSTKEIVFQQKPPPPQPLIFPEQPPPIPRRGDTTTSDGYHSEPALKPKPKPTPELPPPPQSQESFSIIKSKNAELILSVKLKNKEMSKSRLELERRLEETRDKLKSIGYKSLFSSTQDLRGGSYSSKGISRGLDSTTPLTSTSSNEEDSKQIRRACSLSDLNAINNEYFSHRRRRYRRDHKVQQPAAASASTTAFNPNFTLTRSASVSLLPNKREETTPSSSSEDLSTTTETGGGGPTPSYMLQTISSSKKVPQQKLLRGSFSASEQNLTSLLTPTNKFRPTPLPRSKQNTPTLRKPQQIADPSNPQQKGIIRAVVTGIRQKKDLSSEAEEASLAIANLKQSLEIVVEMRNKLSGNSNNDDEVRRILEEGWRDVFGN